jgi:hypothetical protein
VLTKEEANWKAGVEALMAEGKLPPDREMVAAPAFAIIDRLAGRVELLERCNQHRMSDGEMVARALRVLTDTVQDAATAFQSSRCVQCFSDYELNNEIARREMDRDSAKAAVKP